MNLDLNEHRGPQARSIVFKTGGLGLSQKSQKAKKKKGEIPEIMKILIRSSGGGGSV